MAKGNRWPKIRRPADEGEERARCQVVERLKESLAHHGAADPASPALREVWDFFLAVYLPLIRDVVQRHPFGAKNVDDCVQEICKRLIEKQTPRLHKPELSPFEYWLALAIHRDLGDLAVLARSRANREQPLPTGAPDRRLLSAEADVELGELRDRLAAVMKTTLPEISRHHRRILHLRYHCGLSVREVSDRLSVPSKTITSCCRRVACPFLDRAAEDPELAPLLGRVSLPPLKIFENILRIVQNSPDTNGTHL